MNDEDDDVIPHYQSSISMKRSLSDFSGSSSFQKKVKWKLTSFWGSVRMEHKIYQHIEELGPLFLSLIPAENFPHSSLLIASTEPGGHPYLHLNATKTPHDKI